MGYVWWGLAGAALLGVSALMLIPVMTGRSDWLTRIWPLLPWETSDDEQAPDRVEFSALTVGTFVGVSGFFMVAYAVFGPVV